MDSDLTFGTRNWTVRDIPPSHEAISIINPANKTQGKSVIFSFFVVVCFILLTHHASHPYYHAVWFGSRL